jgi:hypothetical protein
MHGGMHGSRHEFAPATARKSPPAETSAARFLFILFRPRQPRRTAGAGFTRTNAIKLRLCCMKQRKKLFARFLDVGL